MRVLSIYNVSTKPSSNFSEMNIKNNSNKLLFGPSFDTVNFQGNGTKALKLVESVVRLSKKEALAKGYIPVTSAKSLHETLSKAVELKHVPRYLDEEATKVLNESRIKIILMNDIKLDKTLENNWVPIETFGGEFNGNGYNINGLRINLPNEKNVGMFRSIKNAQIENLILSDVEVKGGNNTGALLGVNNHNFNDKDELRQYLPIQNCLVQGNVTGAECVGGIVGDMNNAVVKSCVSKANVAGVADVGGIIGSNHYSNTFDSISKAKVTGNFRVGGVIGYNVVSTVENCSSNSNVSGNRFIGGLVGYDYWSTVKNCKTSGNILGKEGVGGIAGDKTEISHVIDCTSNCNLIVNP